MEASHWAGGFQGHQAPGHWRAINPGIPGSMTVTSGASTAQLRAVRGPNLSDSQADSAGSIPVTRSINPQVSGRDAASVRLARLLLISTGHYGPLTAIWHRVPLVSHDSKPASLIDLELMGDLGQRAGQVRPGRTVVGDIALRGPGCRVEAPGGDAISIAPRHATTSAKPDSCEDNDLRRSTNLIMKLGTTPADLHPIPDATGASGAQVRAVRGPDLSDSQADSAGSIPVTRSTITRSTVTRSTTKHQVSGSRRSLASRPAMPRRRSRAINVPVGTTATKAPPPSSPLPRSDST
jgi:hypothetical protein